MGDVGFGLSDEQLQPFAGHCDVLLALVGENLTLRLDDLDRVAFPEHSHGDPRAYTLNDTCARPYLGRPNARRVHCAKWGLA